MDDTKIHLTSLGIMGVPNCRSPAQTPQYHGECSDAQGVSGESPIAPADAPVSFSSSRTCPHSIAGCINPPLFTSQINAMRCSGTVEYIYIYALHISIHICISGQETIIQISFIERQMIREIYNFNIKKTKLYIWERYKSRKKNIFRL